MRVDLYTKAILTVIAICLLAITLKTITAPNAVAAQSRFSTVQFSSAVGGFWLFDTTSGEIWLYNTNTEGISGHYRLDRVGFPLEKR